MAHVIDAIGIFGTLLTTVSFFQDNFATKNPSGATVSIKAGLHDRGNEGDSLSGSINNIYAFDEVNRYEGEASGCNINAGGTCTVTVDQRTAAVRAGYISVSNNNDATCIAWIAVTQYDGTFGGAWTGDIGRACGQRWYKSVEPAGRYKEQDGGGEYVPACTWLDADHTNDIAAAALKFDTGAYGENVQDTIGNDACRPTIFGSDNGPIAAQPGSRKRSSNDRPTWMLEQVIMSNYTSHDAADLCNSATSWGPDFVGVDGMFCDMGTKVLTPLCATKDVDGCVEIDENAATLKKRMNVAERAADVVHKSYKKVQHWGH
ncbi:hypothetical protein BDW02DRAFT_621876 [Decorospora gaudefroyi]|uniref:Uncharacterized protein n=1 Tax=Decorospora gaudefroyi TaxID=184978 RepID=A0A6A5KIK0_9PLEO|nr:hypothetical protein BDW02DRAFT_621876 [Decorospora gaudefroyi]